MIHTFHCVLVASSISSLRKVGEESLIISDYYQKEELNVLHLRCRNRNSLRLFQRGFVRRSPVLSYFLKHRSARTHEPLKAPVSHLTLMG